MKQQILTMLNMQDAMNQKVHPDWRQQGFAWHRAIWVECAEMLEHYGWKWWKKQSPDQDQVVLELVDIWHFGLSLLLQGQADIDGLADQIAAGLQHSVPKENDFKEAIEQFVGKVLQDKRFPLAYFAQLMHWVDLPFEQLFSLYVGKNMLNFFRQDNGYKTGTYQKIWQGREDNEHLMEILSELDPTAGNFKEQVYDALSARYVLAG